MINTKNDDQINIFHIVNYRVLKVLLIPIQVRAVALRETFMGGGVTDGFKEIHWICILRRKRSGWE